MTERQRPEDHPFAEFLRKPTDDSHSVPAASERPVPAAPTSRRAVREAERLNEQTADEVDARFVAEPEPERVPAGVSAGAAYAQRPQARGVPHTPTSSLEADLFGGDFTHHPRPVRRRRRRRGLVALVVILGLLVALGGVGAALFVSFQPQIEAFLSKNQPQDFTGEGNGQAINFVIVSGDGGEAIGDKLQAAGVIKSSATFYQLLLKQSPAPTFHPGTYALSGEMSSQAALNSLTDDKHLVQNTIVIPEGTAAATVLQNLADVTGVPLDQFKAAAADYKSLGVPAEAPSIEGFLFPATYTLQPGETPASILKTMVDRTMQSLDQHGVAPADRFRVVTLASIVQREAGLNADYPKVARVFLNRLDQGWRLQSDATVAYGTGNTHTVETTAAERADATNPYNTYARDGLPVGPIGNPGDVAIDAAIHPATGPWMYFVTWNQDTGETIFSVTEAEHEAAVQKWRQWMSDNGR